MDADVAALCGPKGKHNPNRIAVRNGSERAWLGHLVRAQGAHRAPRMRASDGSVSWRWRRMS